jgi:hypothetical protein
MRLPVKFIDILAEVKKVPDDSDSLARFKHFLERVVGTGHGVQKIQ